MNSVRISAKAWGRRAGPFVLFLALGLLVFVVFSHLRPMLGGEIDLIGRTAVIAMLLLVALWARQSKRLKKYWQVLFAFFVAALATGIDYYLPSSKWLLSSLGIAIKTPAGLALDKLDSSILIIVCILLLTKASGGSLASIYLKKGNLRQGLTFGVIAFLVAAAGSIPLAGLWGAQDLSLTRVLPWIPWILIFIAGNAFNEELLFRGLFLQKMDPLVGRFCSNLVLAIPFVLHHTGVTYTPSEWMFLAELLPLALAWSYVTQQTDNLWGSVLFHAGTDIPIVLVLFSTLH